MTAVEWINTRFGSELTDGDIESVRDFSLYWNIFENVVCANNFSIATVEESFRAKNFDIGDFLNTIDYFRSRYITNSKLNDKFPHLNFRKKDRQNFVEQVLLENNDNTNDVILASIIIISRLRNNLFHGLKVVGALQSQKENFETANQFLQKFLLYY